MTGGNQGLGLGITIVKHLANRLYDEDTIYLCFRNIKRGYHSLNELGQKALQKLSCHYSECCVCVFRSLRSLVSVYSYHLILPFFSLPIFTLSDRIAPVFSLTHHPVLFDDYCVPADPLERLQTWRCRSCCTTLLQVTD